MTQQNDDDLLREAFQELRRDVVRRGAVPDVRAMLERARPDGERANLGRPAAAVASEREADRDVPAWARRSAWISVAAAAAVVALVLLDGGSSRADREFDRLVSAYATDLSAGAWRSPTDALLRTPGIDLGAVPSFGSSLGAFPPRADVPPASDPGRDS